MKRFSLSVLIGCLALSSLVRGADLDSKSPFCVDRVATEKAFRHLCDYVVENKGEMKTIFIGGYYMRSLVAGYELFGERRYLECAVSYADKLLALQNEHGYWGTGYGNIYLADTGSALGLFIVLNKHVPTAKQTQFQAAIQRFVDAIEKDGLINPSGAFGTGYKGTPDGRITGIFQDEYTISSALSGGEVFTWLYRATKVDRYRQEAYRALRWILGTMRADGNIPHVLAGLGGDFNKHGDPENDDVLWHKYTGYVSTYVGEGMMSFERYCDSPEWRKEMIAGMKPQIEFLLRTQNENGSWNEAGGFSQKRSPGIANTLIWYYYAGGRDERLVTAVQKFNRLLTDPSLAKEFGLLDVGGDANGTSPASKDGKFVPNDILTALSGRALADMLRPGVDLTW